MSIPGWVVTMLAAVVPWIPINGWLWSRFYRTLFKAHRHDDHEDHISAIRNNIHGKRLHAALLTGMTSKAACWDRVSEVDCRSLVIVGTADPDFPDPITEAREVAKALDARLVLADGVGHYPHQERPLASADAIVACLQEGPCRAESA